MRTALFFLIVSLITPIDLKGQENTNTPFQLDSIFYSWVPVLDSLQDETRVITISKDWFEVTTNDNIIRYSYNITDSTLGDGSIIIKLCCGLKKDGVGSGFIDIGLYDHSSIVALYLQEDLLVILPGKDGELAPGEFSMPEAFIRSHMKSPIDSVSKVKAIFKLPDGFSGYSWVALDQPDGVPAEFDNDDRIKINIPESGILKSKEYFMPVAIAKRELAFYFQSELNKGSEPILQIDENWLSFLVENNFTEREMETYGYSIDDVYVYYYRYNNPGRREINKIFEEEISGQVFWFRVDTLRNLLKSEPMIPRQIIKND